MQFTNIKISATQLKCIALITMIIDHIGIILFPDILILRYIGRLAFPIYAFLVGEGLLHTKNRKKYFLKMLATFVTFEIVYVFVRGEWSLCVLYGFLCAILIVEICEWAKKDLIKRRPIVALPISILFISTMAFSSDYMFCAILLPLIVYYIKDKKKKMLLFFICLAFYSILSWDYQILSLIAIIPLLLYSGEKGKNFLFKNSFYIMYPLHYAIIGVINFVLKGGL